MSTLLIGRFGYSHKYDLGQSNKESLSHFIDKLREKNQSDQQQKQASHAVSIYYEIGTTNSGENVSFKNKNRIISTEKEGLKAKTANWKPAYDDLDPEIKIRHYSPKTLCHYMSPNL